MNRPGYTEEVLINETIKTILTKNTNAKNCNEFINIFSKLTIEQQKFIISSVFSIQSEYLYNSFKQNIEEIYIPFIGKFQYRIGIKAKELLIEDNIELTEDNKKTKIKELRLNKSLRDKFVVGVNTVVPDNLDEIFKIINK